MMFFDWWLDRLVRIEGKLDQTLSLLKQVLQKETQIMGAIEDALDRAEAAAKKDDDAEAAILGLLQALAEQITALKASVTDPAVVARIEALADGINTRAEALAAAVVAGTPAA